MSTERPLLAAGQRLDRSTFHARYEAMPPDFRAELIGGVVHVTTRVSRRHGEMTATVAFWLTSYRIRTPGICAALHVTTFLDDDSEPEPDSQLPEAGQPG